MMKMKKRAGCMSLALSFLLCILFAVPAQAAASENAASAARNGVVRILAVRDNGTFWMGSAFAVGEAGEPSSVFVKMCIRDSAHPGRPEQRRLCGNRRNHAGG